MYSTQHFTLQKGIHSFLTHGRFVPSRFVSFRTESFHTQIKSIHYQFESVCTGNASRASA